MKIMTTEEIALRRLRGQSLVAPPGATAAAVVSRLGAMQAQDYAGAKWAIGQRTAAGLTDADVERAFNAGEILRTHILRPTWHFVAAADIRWMLALSAPRVKAANASMYRTLELDDAVFRKSHKVIEKALRDGQRLKRAELAAHLIRAGVADAEGNRLAHLMMQAELDGVLTSGGRNGNHFTYALFESRVPPASALDRDQALIELARRYFATRGPATLHDFAMWSGLTVTDGKRAISALGKSVEGRDVRGKMLWFDPLAIPAKSKKPLAHLLPSYDEYFIGYKDRTAIASRTPEGFRKTFLSDVAAINGQLIGEWREEFRKHAVPVYLTACVELRDAEKRALIEAAQSYGRFLGLKASLEFSR